MFNQNVIKQPKFEDSLTKLHVNMKEYLHLFSPSVEWILSCIGHFASVVRNFLRIFYTQKKIRKNSKKIKK